ncbi:MAG: RluA family pseudouridine synthase [Maricaulaceae bacterium]
MSEAQDRAFAESLVIHDAPGFLVIDKPAGLAVQTRRLADDPDLESYLSLLAKPNRQMRLVHRLDRPTSGVMVVARTKPAAAALSRAFAERRIEKIYLARVAPPPDPPEGDIEAPLIKVKGRPGDRVGDHVRVARPGEAAAMDALTRYRVLEAQAGGAWLALSPVTGRLHQLRAHLAHIGAPIVGDRKYGGAPADRLMLHAWRLAFPDPQTGERLVFEAEPPAGFGAAVPH